jgi:hypothetical protein
MTMHDKVTALAQTALGDFEPVEIPQPTDYREGLVVVVEETGRSEIHAIRVWSPEGFAFFTKPTLPYARRWFVAGAVIPTTITPADAAFLAGLELESQPEAAPGDESDIAQEGQPDA